MSRGLPLTRKISASAPGARIKPPRPGVRYRPVALVRWASGGISTLPWRPMAAILPSRIRTAELGWGGLGVPSIRVAPTMAMGGGAGGAAGSLPQD